MPETPRRKRRDQGSPGSESASVRSEESEEVGSVGRGKRKSFTAAQQALSTPSKKRRMSQVSKFSPEYYFQVHNVKEIFEYLLFYFENRIL